MNREEVDAKIGASEARTDSKFASVIAKLDVLIARMDKLEVEMRELRTQMSNLKITVVLTGVSSVLAVVFGMAGFNAALVGDITATFESGKATGQWQNEIRKQSIETELALTRIRKQLDTIDARQAQMGAELEKIKQERASGRR